MHLAAQLLWPLNALFSGHRYSNCWPISKGTVASVRTPEESFGKSWGLARGVTHWENVKGKIRRHDNKQNSSFKKSIFFFVCFLLFNFFITQDGADLIGYSHSVSSSYQDIHLVLARNMNKILYILWYYWIAGISCSNLAFVTFFVVQKQTNRQPGLSIWLEGLMLLREP